LQKSTIKYDIGGENINGHIMRDVEKQGASVRSRFELDISTDQNGSRVARVLDIPTMTSSYRTYQ